MNKTPIILDLDDEDDSSPRPQDAPAPDAPQGQAMQVLGRQAERSPSLLSRVFWPLAASFVGLIATTLAYDWITATMAARPWLGAALALLALCLLLIAIMAIVKEAAAYLRLGRIDRLRAQAETALAGADLKQAREVTTALMALTATRKEQQDAQHAVKRAIDEMVDADSLLAETERRLMAPLDQEAEQAVAQAARQVALVTALVPLALADVIAALLANLRMIRRIGEIYGGRSGRVANWRMTRTVLAHLAAAGALSATDDLLESFAGGGVLSKLSRRFGEGLVNGALTARVGVAAIEVCRPLPFVTAERPSASRITRRALSQLISGKRSSETPPTENMK